MCEPEVSEEIVQNLVCSTHVARQCGGGDGGDGGGTWTERCEGEAAAAPKKRRGKKEPRTPRDHEQMIVSKTCWNSTCSFTISYFFW